MTHGRVPQQTAVSTVKVAECACRDLWHPVPYSWDCPQHGRVNVSAGVYMPEDPLARPPINQIARQDPSAHEGPNSGIPRPQRRDRPKKSQPQLVDVPSTKPAGWTSDCWGTPPEMVREMEAEFGAFELDPCATPETAKAPKFYTVFENGLLQPWHGRVWLNPPYSDPTPWLQRAVAAQEDGCLVVALLPASTDANWFHDLVLPNAEVRFIRQRVRFIGWQGTPIPSPIAPNLWAIFHPSSRGGTSRTCPKCKARS